MMHWCSSTRQAHYACSGELQAATDLQSLLKLPAMSSKYGVRLLMQDYVQLSKHPIPHIRVAPEENNLYMCHFLLTFDLGVCAGGEYHGRLELPNEYPMAPPHIIFFTQWPF
jgi:ubiquitin-conjugating enzyme E2 J1